MYAYCQNVPITRAIYEKIAERLGKAPMNGLIAHVVIENTDGSLEYVDVWESEDHCARAFDERIHPAVYATFSELGSSPKGSPVGRSFRLSKCASNEGTGDGKNPDLKCAAGAL